MLNGFKPFHWNCTTVSDSSGSLCLRWHSQFSAAAYFASFKPQRTLKAPLSPNPFCRHVKERWRILFSASPTHAAAKRRYSTAETDCSPMKNQSERSDRPRMEKQNKESKKEIAAQKKGEILRWCLKRKEKRGEQMEYFSPPFPQVAPSGLISH